MRVQRIECTECGEPATIRKTNRKHRELADLYCCCSNVECGHTFVMTQTFSHTISPSALGRGNLYKALVDAVKPEDREMIIAMLQGAAEADKIIFNHPASVSKIIYTRRPPSQ
ncbi:ogr/Delta-like zinc finger family protein [Erwinia persicina]|uniref:ogr/Delta-like zinc finger family protein n=1 Tax=Erwinia persicina TaxID=55211 RepID=UPI00177E795E|nr:ogr/Delta-like zinc finger family protein [Erwinia persicina]MBD8163708.1 ogr/Delta-like zinc finger family protein [Erwinia persicina]